MISLKQPEVFENVTIPFKKMILGIIILFIVLLIVSHYLKYKKSNEKYEILQINNPVDNYTKYFNEELPLVILNHNESDLNNIISPITIVKNTIILDKLDDKYMYHNKDNLFIIADEETYINLSIPGELKNFKKTTEQNKHVRILSLDNKNSKSITIVLKKGNIVRVPKFWIFNIENSTKNVKIFYSQTLFSSLFSIFN